MEQELRNPKLSAVDITSGYGQMTILRKASVGIEPQQIVAIIGPNGAGKSTLLKTICGLLKVRQGTIKLDGRDITGASTRNRLKKGLSYVPQAGGTFPNMSVKENLEMGAFLNRTGFEQASDRVLAFFPTLKDRLKQAAGTMSGGEQQMVAVARALMLEPSVLLLDEPSAGLAPRYVDFLFEKIKDISSSGVSVLVVEQNVKKILKIADWVYVLAEGTNKIEGTSEQILNNPRLRTLYLGET